MKIIYTLGHSDRSIDEFINILIKLKIKVLIDVRRWPSSRRHPHFNLLNLSRTLGNYGIDYMWIEKLGGYRKFNIDVPDYGIAKCFESEGFRAYATYITRNLEVKKWLSILLDIASQCLCIIMCSEKLPWFCHRKILSDYLVIKGFRVLHYIDEDSIIEHKLSRCARIVNNELDYV